MLKDRAQSRSAWRVADIPPLLWFIILIGVLLRILWIAVFDVEPVSDPQVYLTRARSIVMGHGYSYSDGSATSYWPVGYPAFLAGVLYLGGGAALAGKLANIGLFVCTCVLIVAVGIKTHLGVGGKAAVIFLALSPNQIAYANLFASEPLALALLLGFVCYYLETHRRCDFSWPCAIATSLFFAAAYYVKPQVVFLPGLGFLVAASCGSRALKRNIATNVVVCLIGAAAIAPWIARNYREFGQFIPISTNGGINLYIGNNSYATGGYRWDSRVNSPLEGLSEYEKDQEAARLARRYIKTHPMQVIKLAPVKVWLLLKTDSEGIAWNEGGLAAAEERQHAALFGLKVVSQLFYMGWWLLSIWGLASLLRQRKLSDRWALVPAFVVTYCVATYAVFFGATRFHYIFVPLMFLYSGVVLQLAGTRLPASLIPRSGLIGRGSRVTAA